MPNDFTQEQLDAAAKESEQLTIDDLRSIILEQKDVRGGFTVFTTVPSHEDTEGKFLLYKDTTNGIYRLYAVVNGAWRKIGDSQFISQLGIGALTDVTITSVADNELLAFDSSSGEWINQTQSEAGISDTLPRDNLQSLLDVGSFVESQGQILYRAGSIWSGLDIGVVGNHLMTQGASKNPRWTGTSTLYASSNASTNHTGTTTETDIVTAVISQGDMGANGIVRMTAFGIHSGNGSTTITLKWDTTGNDLVVATFADTNTNWFLQGYVVNQNDDALQHSAGFSINSAPNIDDLASNDYGGGSEIATDSNDSTVALTGALASDGESITVKGFIVEVLKRD